MDILWIVLELGVILLVVLPSGLETDDQQTLHGDARPCLPRAYNQSVVCVCNPGYCDDVIRILPEPGKYVTYTSSKSGLRFHITKGSLTRTSNSDRPDQDDIKLDRSKKYQTIEGFGGAVTDAAGLNWLKLNNPSLQRKLIDSYFGKNGLEYNLIRTTIGASDFSEQIYVYNAEPVNDTLLTNFTLAPEDFLYKIPMIKAAMAAATTDIHVLAATWSPPTWMKTPHRYLGWTELIPEFYQTYADYHLKFIEHYEAQNIPIWAISTGNEPITSTLLDVFQSLGWKPDKLGKWISENLGPTIHKSHRNVKILANDDQRPDIILLFEQVVESHPEALQYIDGIAVHWYIEIYKNHTILADTYKKFPDKFLISTEASEGSHLEKQVVFGSWSRAQEYATNIIVDLTNYVVGWIDWNLVLNTIGGPNWSGNFVDAAIIVFPESQEFVKQPIYYAMGHFAKYIPRGSVRIHSAIDDSPVFHVAFQTPQDTVVLVIYNPQVERTVRVSLGDQGATIKLAADSIVTMEMKS